MQGSKGEMTSAGCVRGGHRSKFLNEAGHLEWPALIFYAQAAAAAAEYFRRAQAFSTNLSQKERGRMRQYGGPK